MFVKSSRYQILSNSQRRCYKNTTIRKSNLNIGQRYLLKVSTTRGIPSTSTNLKEALCEKIPIHYDLLRNFRKEHGQSVISRITVNNIYDGLQGVNMMVRETSENDPKYGIRYRGLTIPEVLNLLPRRGTSPSVEAVFWLLLTGDVPTQEQTTSLINDWSSRRQRRKEWWSGPSGGIVGSVLQNLPDNVTPLARLSIALTILQTNKYTKKAIENGAPSHTHWEHIYEDSMELLAALPAVIGLVGKGRELRNVTEEGDWIDFLLQCLSNSWDDLKGRTTSVGDFLRLYVSLNADEDGGVPAVHITQISGSSYLDISQALSSGVLLYENEPITGTMFQLSQDITRVLAFLMKNTKNKIIFPEQTTIAGPIFQFYGLKDMKFNQVLLCMSRALGAIASIIWTRAIDAPVEQPKSNSTYTYFYSLRNIRNRMKKRIRIKQIPKIT
ncbi:hypothetical protein M0802_003638 [Mischocyttarus mexicanus]|nr:hypothetical protein M0802_003638 [Mischocyttarus mexicanus]